jgi:hypothetical protein
MEAIGVCSNIHSWDLLRRTEENHGKSVVTAGFTTADLIPERSKLLI